MNVTKQSNNREEKAGKHSPVIPWSNIQTVLLDMDGTLLDLNFDNTFFRETVPQAVAKQRGIPVAEARQLLHSRYKQVEGTLAWYDLDYWSRELAMDIPQLKQEVIHLIRPHPQTMAFLQQLHKMGKEVHLVTNAHPHSLALKFHHTTIGTHLTSVITSHTIGIPKENTTFWLKLSKNIEFDKKKTLLVDDSEPVLLAAEQYGIAYLRHIAAPSSTQHAVFSKHFISVIELGHLMPHPLPTE